MAPLPPPTTDPVRHHDPGDRRDSDHGGTPDHGQGYGGAPDHGHAGAHGHGHGGTLPPRPGDLTPGWLLVFGLGWLAAALALAAVWSASRQIGLSTWWLGPPARPRPVFVNVVPFVAPLALVVAAVNRVRYLPWLGVAGAVAIAAVGLGDLGRVRGLGIAELVIAGAAALVSLASLAGMYRSAR